MAWNSPPNDLGVLRRMRECGLTVAGFVPVAGLDHSQEAGLKAIVSDPRVGGYDWLKVDAAVAKAQVAELVQEVKNHPAVLGYYLRDEPTTLSYDNYSLLEGGQLRDGYFANLESMRKAGVKHKLPFWNIVLAVSHFNYREMSPADARFQAYTSLAYGVRGLAWFTYFTPAIGNYRAGAIDQFGNETPTWAVMQNVNLQIGKLGPTLLKLTSDRVYHFGEVSADCTGPDDKSLVKAIEGPMLVGDFTHQDVARYVMIVNKVCTASHVCASQFRGMT